LLALLFQRFMFLDVDASVELHFRQGILRHAQEYAKFESRPPVLANAGRAQLQQAPKGDRTLAQGNAVGNATRSQKP
jgi:hypothetical protein